MFKQYLNDWQRWGLRQEPELIRPFSAGQNHQTALIRAGDEHWVLKVFGHSFAQAMSAQHWAATLGIAPTIKFSENNVSIIEYIDGEEAKSNDVHSLAAALQVLHAAPTPAWPQFDLMAFCQQYLSSADPLIQQWHRALTPALQIFTEDSTPWCACHNDLVVENCLVRNARAFFIDWEYAMLHNPWFDLAAIILYLKLNENQARDFLKHYHRDFENSASGPIFYAAQIAVLWGDLLWHIDRYGSQYRLENGDRFDQLIALAGQLKVALPSQPQ